MSKSYIPSELRELVATDARHRCGYCHSTEVVAGMAFEIDHLIPESMGGPTLRENLWLACPACNPRKASRMSALDPETGQMCRLFNPRRQVWSEHFRWNETCDSIIGLSPTGRATVDALDLNRPILVIARQLWVEAGWHPPKD